MGIFGGVDYTDVSLASGLWSLDYGFDLGNGSKSVRLTYVANPVPIPAAVWLFGSGLLGLIGIIRKKVT